MNSKNIIKYYFSDIYTIWRQYQFTRNSLKYGNFPTKNTDLLIGSYPRSGNTYLYTYLKLYLKSNIDIAHHIHCPSTFIYSIKNKIPAIILIRRPEESIASLMVYYMASLNYKPSIEEALDNYLLYYKLLLKYINDYILLINFEDLLNKPNKVISSINNKYNFSFDLFTDKEKVDSDIFSLLRALNKELSGGDPNQVFYKTKYKEDNKSKYLNKLYQNDHKNRLDCCVNIYNELIMNEELND